MTFNSERVAVIASATVLVLSVVGGILVFANRGPGAPVLNTQAVPEAYRSMVVAAGRRCPDVSAPLLAAQIEVESGWNPNAVSKSGAEGLAQFTPATWKQYGIDGSGDGHADPFTPADAIASQANFMCALVGQLADLAKQTGTPVVDLALGAYNAGPGAVLKKRGIPAGSQGYVVKIKSLVPKYTLLTGGATTGWRDPIDGAFTRGTGFWVPGPLWKWKGHHTGVDYVAATGTRIVAAGPGTISAIANGGAYGMHVTIADGTVDGKRIETLYAHMSAFADVHQGQQVQAGELIGFVGQTGNTTGPHLHFEVHQNWTGGNDDGEFLDGFAWVDTHRGAADPSIGQKRVAAPVTPLDGDDGPPN